MPAIATIGAVVTITPGADIQIVLRPDQSKFIDDRSPFSIRVDGILEDDGTIIAIYGDIISGHARYREQIATLFVRVDNADWRIDNRSGSSFKIGQNIANRNAKHHFLHPEGSNIDGLPFIIGYGSVDSRSEDEVDVNCAIEYQD